MPRCYCCTAPIVVQRYTAILDILPASCLSATSQDLVLKCILLIQVAPLSAQTLSAEPCADAYGRHLINWTCRCTTALQYCEPPFMGESSLMSDDTPVCKANLGTRLLTKSSVNISRVWYLYASYRCH